VSHSRGARLSRRWHAQGYNVEKKLKSATEWEEANSLLETTADSITIIWTRPRYDGWSSVTGYVVERRSFREDKLDESFACGGYWAHPARAGISVFLLTHSWHKKCCTCVYRAQVNVLWLHFRFPILLFFDFFLRERGVKTKGKKDDVMICWELARACFSRILIRLARAWHNLSLFLWPIWIPCVKKTRFLFLYSPCRIIGTVRLCGVRKKNPKFFVYVYSLKQKKKRS
jgi:hypothetical protein